MMRLAPDGEDRLFMRRITIVGIAMTLAILLYRIGDILLLAFGATLIAVLLATASDWLASRANLPRAVTLTLVIISMLTVLTAMGWLFVIETGVQAAHLWQTLPQDWTHLEWTAQANPIGKLIVNSFHEGSQGTRFAHLLLSTGWGSMEVIANILIVLIGGIFFAAQPQIYRKGLLILTPPTYRQVAADAADDVLRALRLWLLTQLVSMTMMGVMIGLGLWWSGVQAPAALGLLGGLSEFIPYVGPTLAMVPAIVVAAVGQGSIWGVLGTYFVVRVVQVQIITPLISQSFVSVPAGLYLFLILAMGAAFGVYGIFFAGALSVAAYTIVIRVYARETLGAPVDPPGKGDV